MWRRIAAEKWQSFTDWFWRIWLSFMIAGVIIAGLVLTIFGLCMIWIWVNVFRKPL